MRRFYPLSKHPPLRGAMYVPGRRRRGQRRGTRKTLTVPGRTPRGGNFWPGWPLLGALLLLTLFRTLIAAQTPLSPDETYYWVWSHALQSGYPDHPPMVALFIWIGTALIGESPLGVRLLAPLAALGGSFFIALAAHDFSPNPATTRRNQIVSVALLNATLAINAGAVIITPDTPLLLFWSAALACLGRFLATSRLVWLLWLGAAMGLAMLSKYTAALGGAGIVLWLLITPQFRPLFKRFQLYWGGAIAAIIFAPVLLWNAANNWVSFSRQGGRITDFAPLHAPQFLAELIGAQILLMTPLILILFGAGLIFCARGWRTDPVKSLLACVTLVPLAVFVQHAIGARVQANWLAILYPSLALAACLAPPRFTRPAVLLGAALSVLVMLQAAFAPFDLPRNALSARLGGWDNFAALIHEKSNLSSASFVAADEYGLASELAYHFSAPITAVDPRWWYFRGLARAPLDNGTGLLVLSEHRAATPDPKIWGPSKLIARIPRIAYGSKAETYFVYKVTPPQQVPNAVMLPVRQFAPSPLSDE